MRDKNQVQREIIDILKTKNIKGIVLASVRSGKCRQILTAIKEHTLINNPKIFLSYPNTDIKNSWIRECELINFFPEFIFSTFMSLEKNKNIVADYYVFDEAHLLAPDTQLVVAGEIALNNKHVIFASGTYNKDTLSDIKFYTKLDLIVNYPTSEAIKDGIVSDFTVYIHKYNLDNSKIIQFGKVKKWNSTEKKECNRLGNRILKLSGQQKMFASLERMRFINSCNSLIEKVNKWISENKNERFILFSSDEKTGLKYNLPMFNSKSKDDSVLKNFQSGKINQLCLLKKASAGVSFPNLQNILITAINSNGENLEQMIGRSLLDDTDHSHIHIFVSTEDFQNKWLAKSLELINKNKIKYV